jgi:hypothetical protein
MTKECFIFMEEITHSLSLRMLSESDITDGYDIKFFWNGCYNVSLGNWEEKPE